MTLGLVSTNETRTRDLSCAAVTAATPTAAALKNRIGRNFTSPNGTINNCSLTRVADALFESGGDGCSLSDWAIAFAFGSRQSRKIATIQSETEGKTKTRNERLLVGTLLS